MYKINPLMYPELISVAEKHTCGKVYPLSVVEGFQEGEVLSISMKAYENVLFWAQCGFAYLSEKCDSSFLGEIYKFMKDINVKNMEIPEVSIDRDTLIGKRFLLMTSDKHIADYFMAKTDMILETRYLFEYSGNQELSESSIPEGYELKEIDNHLLTNLSGNVVPLLFWKESKDFLSKGKGYCIVHDNDIASWAFSAAVSSKELDIGIETSSQFRHQGLGLIVAKKMIQYTLEQGKKPVWACHCKNIASKRIAEKLGFIKVAECSIIKRNNS